MKKVLKWFGRLLKLVICMSLCIGLVLGGLQLGHAIAKRNHGAVKVYDDYTFTETAEYLPNPNRGFYYMYGFMISDENDPDYMAEVHQRMGGTHEMTLAMVHVNLQKYNDGPISEKGLKDIEELFQALETMDRQYLLRFLYDWDGRNEEVEPQDVEVILTHMKQLKEIFRKYKECIFVHQGLFIGNWGEMNGTRHLEHMQILATTLHDVMHEDTFFGVRMPAQWRKITETADPAKSSWQEASVADTLSLYNDGMLGSFSDYGTYGEASRKEVGDFTHWNRQEELAFQEELCKYVPNGGEVIVENPYNDFENALADMRTMHITYINRDYDQNVLNKWAETTITEKGCFNGMDGLTYMERHLGYRFVIRDTSLAYEEKKDVLTVGVSLQNVGFAPVYKEAHMNVVLENNATGETRAYRLPQDIRKLTGGNESEKLLNVESRISLNGLEAGEYTLYFHVKDVDSDKQLLFANEQEKEKLGYEIGTLTIEPYSFGGVFDWKTSK